jgi:predicted DNA-binding protein YlxM (UPF0122 family)
MEKNVELTLLYETYKELLTDNMKDVFEMYYYSDLSLREIAEEKKISYQGVNDTLKKTEKILKDYENKLSYSKVKKIITKLNNKLEEENVDLNEVKQIARKLGEV